MSGNSERTLALAELLFPAGTAGTGSTLSAEDYEAKYPPRGLSSGAFVTRLGPSPTGFIHLGNLFMAMVNQRLAAQSGGIFFLRIEDTDQKREVEGAVPGLIDSLAYFGIAFGEGVGLWADARLEGAGAYNGEADAHSDGVGVCNGEVDAHSDGAGVCNDVGNAHGNEADVCNGEVDAHSDGVALACERGVYGPYFQSKRREIYSAYAKKLVAEGKAYPCFLTENEIGAIRSGQEAAKALPGVYGAYAKWRGADIEEVAERISAGEPYVLRLFAGHTDRICGTGGTGGTGYIDGADGMDNAGGAGGVGCAGHIDCMGNAAPGAETITVSDGIRGDISMPKNIMDVVMLKKDGLPTYHFAHVVDDHLMGTTHVVRGEEWLSSLPVHIALSEALGFVPPVYCHTALLMKADGGVKRKLSKRSDPEAALSYYIAEGYHPLAMQEYILTLINSDYEEWRLSNPELDSSDFVIKTEKMGAAGMLLDIDKLQNVSREMLARIPAHELAGFVIEWAGRERADALPVLLENRDVLTAALDIGRSGEKPRKDLVYAAQIFEFISYFFDPYFHMSDPLPDNMPDAEAHKLLKGYLADYCHADGRELWFEKIRGLASAHGYAPKPKDYKNDPDMYKGHVGDVSMVIRRALTGRQNAPDIYEIQQILGEQRTRVRVEAATH